MYAAVVVLRMEDMSLVEVRGAIAETTFRYQPGYLSFREAPALLEAFARVRSKPDAILLDGQGLAHPRRLGLASHVGLWLRKPSCGLCQEPADRAVQDPCRRGRLARAAHRQGRTDRGRRADEGRGYSQSMCRRAT